MCPEIQYQIHEYEFNLEHGRKKCHVQHVKYLSQRYKVCPLLSSKSMFTRFKEALMIPIIC